MSEVNLTATQRKCLAVLAEDRFNEYCLPLDSIARQVGYRPARRGRLPVLSALRALLVPRSDKGELVGRIAPRDQWDTEKWCITPAGRLALEKTEGEE